jgi:hypothetical protein
MADVPGSTPALSARVTRRIGALATEYALPEAAGDQLG